MKVINKSETKDEKWCVGDVIAFKANKESMAIYAMIIEETSYDNRPLGLPPLVATAVLNGHRTGDWGYMKEIAWQDNVWCSDLDKLRKCFEDSCYQVKRVPFYGVVGKPEEN